MNYLGARRKNFNERLEIRAVNPINTYKLYNFVRSPGNSSIIKRFFLSDPRLASPNSELRCESPKYKLNYILLDIN